MGAHCVQIKATFCRGSRRTWVTFCLSWIFDSRGGRRRRKCNVYILKNLYFKELLTQTAGRRRCNRHQCASLTQPRCPASPVLRAPPLPLAPLRAWLPLASAWALLPRAPRRALARGRLGWDLHRPASPTTTTWRSQSRTSSSPTQTTTMAPMAPSLFASLGTRRARTRCVDFTARPPRAPFSPPNCQRRLLPPPSLSPVPNPAGV